HGFRRCGARLAERARHRSGRRTRAARAHRGRVGQAQHRGRRHEGVQSRAKAVGLQGVRLACGSHARLIPSCMPDKPRYYITTAIAYPNGAPHIGYGYEVMTTDAIARFKRLDGYDVFFLTGTDEHGIKMLQTANKEGLTAQQFA